MPKNKVKNIGTSSLKVKPKKRPGLFKQLSQPFLASNKKNKNCNVEETEDKIVPHMVKDDLGFFSGFDDMFLPDRIALSESVFLSPEIEKYLKNEDLPLTIDIPQRDKCSSADSGYTSPPCPELLSPSAPAKGILKKKRSNSPDVRCDSPLFTVQSSDSQLYTSAPVLNGNSHLSVERPMSPLERAVSPLSVENALGFLDDVIEEESKQKVVKKSVSFGELAEVKNFTSDSSDNDICDDFKPIRKSISFGDVENLKRKKDTINECNRSFKKSVSFEDITEKRESESDSESGSDESLIPVHDSDSSCSDSEKFEKETVSSDCTSNKVCQFEVEVKVVDIQPLSQGEGHNQQNNEEYSCTLLDSFNILVSYQHFIYFSAKCMNKLNAVFVWMILWFNECCFTDIIWL